MKSLLFLLFVSLSFTALHAQSEAEKRKKNYNLEDGLAIEGYDPVSYFSGKPLKGKKDLSYAYNNVTYRFASEANREAFRRDPSHYEPQYGGWCAFAMGDSGEKVSVDPKTYKIIDGRLYLFYNQFFNNTLEKWNKNEMPLKKKADQHWTKIYP